MSLSLPSFLSPYRMPEVPTDSYDAARRGAELVTADGRSLPLLSSRLRAEAAGGIARVVLEQTFENRHEETLHVTYKMPLPADGAVSGYEFQVGLRQVKGHVESKEKARESFEVAIAEGRTAALLEQERADIFTQEIGNVPPNTSIVARITVDQPLTWLPEGEWELRFPTVIGPRYVGALDSEADASAVRIAVAEEIGARVHLELTVRDTITQGRSIESPSHRLVALPGEEGRFTLATPEGERLDRDIVARWSVAQPDVGLSLGVARPPKKALPATCAYGLLTIVPPAPEAGFATLPRDLIVLLDTSGSMGGAPLEQAKKVIALLIESLGAADRLELIEFSSRPNRWRKGPEAVTRETKKQAIQWVKARSAGGGTEMCTAVMEALTALRPNAQRQVVLVTDGYIGGEQRIIDLCHERLPVSCRLHVVGVGAAANRSLATALARAGRGAEILVDLDADVERPAKRLLDRTAAPVLTDLVLGGDAVIEQSPEHLTDVFVGAPLLAAVKLSPEGGEIVVRGNLAHGVWEQRVRVPAFSEGEGNQAIVALYAREHVADLEMRWSLGKEAAMIDRTIEKVGLAFQIATRRTSWVAIDDIVSVDPTKSSRHEAQPHEIPYGTSIASFGLQSQAAGVEYGLLDRAVTRPGAVPSFAQAAMPFPLASPAPAMDGAAKERRSQHYIPVAPSGLPSSMSAPMRKRRSRGWLVFLGFLVLFLLALLAYLLTR